MQLQQLRRSFIHVNILLVGDQPLYQRLRALMARIRFADLSLGNGHINDHIVNRLISGRLVQTTSSPEKLDTLININHELAKGLRETPPA